MEAIKEIGISLILAFFISQLINVILSTIKSVLTIKGTRLTATIINAVSYTINAGVISQIGGINNIWVVCGVTAITNLAGVYFSLWLLDKLRKDRLWRINASVKKEYLDELKNDLNNKDIKFITYTNDWKKYAPIDVFSYSREESSTIREIFSKYQVKYTISPNTNYL